LAVPRHRATTLVVARPAPGADARGDGMTDTVGPFPPMLTPMPTTLSSRTAPSRSFAAAIAAPVTFFVLALAFALALASAPPVAAAAQPEATSPADPLFWYSRAPDGTPRIRVHFFWTSRCPNCQAAKPFMEDLPRKLPYVELVSHPTDGSATNRRLQYVTAKSLGADPTSVPAIFFCGESQIGYDDAQGIGASLVRRIDACRTRLAQNPALLTTPVRTIPKEQWGESSGGSTVAIVLGLAFLGTLALAWVMARKSAAAAREAGPKPAAKKRKKR
jgi:glutaredoxin